MLYILTLFFLILAAPAHADLTTNLAWYYNLTEASGSRSDSAGAGLTLTENGTVNTGTAPDGSSNAASMGGASFLEHADNAGYEFGDADFSIVAWVRLAAVGSGSYNWLGKWNSGTDERSYVLRYENGANLVFFLSSAGTSSTTCDTSTFGAPSAATWYLFAATYDAGTDTIACSVNAGTQNTASHAGGMHGNTSTFQIGGINGVASLDGRVALAGGWTRKLSTAEITQLYNSGAGCTYAQLTGACAGGGGGATAVRRRAIMVY